MGDPQGAQPFHLAFGLYRAAKRQPLGYPKTFIRCPLPLLGLTALVVCKTTDLLTLFSPVLRLQNQQLAVRFSAGFFERSLPAAQNEETKATMLCMALNLPPMASSIRA